MPLEINKLLKYLVKLLPGLRKFRILYTLMGGYSFTKVSPILFPDPLENKEIKNISNFLQTLSVIFFRTINIFRSRIYNDLPLAVYDLRICPISYDFGYFLYESECFFNTKGYKTFRVLIIPNVADNQLIYPYLAWNKLVNEDKRRSRIINLILPIAYLYKACSDVLLVSDIQLVRKICRSQLVLFPKNYDGFFLRTHLHNFGVYDYERNGFSFTGFHADSHDILNVKYWLKSVGILGPFVTFTIRNFQHQPERNSKTAVYAEFIEYLASLGFQSIIIPDSEDISIPTIFLGLPVFYSASFSLFQRQSIYELAFTNIFAANGCATLCVLNNNCSFIYSGLITKEFPRELYDKRGFRYKSQPFTKDRGVWEWGEETFDSLLESFNIILSYKNNQLNSSL